MCCQYNNIKHIVAATERYWLETVIDFHEMQQLLHHLRCLCFIRFLALSLLSDFKRQVNCITSVQAKETAISEQRTTKDRAVADLTAQRQQAEGANARLQVKLLHMMCSVLKLFLLAVLLSLTRLQSKQSASAGEHPDHNKAICFGPVSVLCLVQT